MNPNDTAYGYYGARGIRVCERWDVFENFLADMGECPPNGTLDRIDTNGNYEPSNCRWVTQAEQLRNTRRNHIVSYAGKDWCVTDLATHLGIAVGTLRQRIKSGWARERWNHPPLHK
jgi:hypothetical protein